MNTQRIVSKSDRERPQNTLSKIINDANSFLSRISSSNGRRCRGGGEGGGGGWGGVFLAQACIRKCSSVKSRFAD